MPDYSGFLEPRYSRVGADSGINGYDSISRLMRDWMRHRPPHPDARNDRHGDEQRIYHEQSASVPPRACRNTIAVPARWPGAG